jgi:hypothetical protein
VQDAKAKAATINAAVFVEHIFLLKSSGANRIAGHYTARFGWVFKSMGFLGNLQQKTSHWLIFLQRLNAT